MPVRKAQPPVEGPPVQAAVTRKLGLAPSDWTWATWRKFERPPKPPARPFDLDGCVRQVAGLTIQDNSKWNWGGLAIPIAELSPKEAHFWWRAFTTSTKGRDPGQLAALLASWSYDDSFPTEELRNFPSSGLTDCSDGQIIRLTGLLPVLLNPIDLVALLRQEVGRSLCRGGALVDELRTNVGPFLTDAERDQIRHVLADDVQPAKWLPAIHQDRAHLFYAAAALGLHAECLAVVEPWKPGAVGLHVMGGRAYPSRVLFGLGSRDLVEHHFRRVGLQLHTVVDVKAWLAHTEFSALDLVAKSMLGLGNWWKTLLPEFAAIEAPEMAEQMLRLREGRFNKDVRPIARQWLETQIGNTIAGLIPVAASDGPQAEAALAHLQDLCRRGHGDLIRQQLDQLAPEMARVACHTILAPLEMEPPPFSQAPDWLQDAMATASKKAKLADWLRLTALPAIQVGNHRLDDAQMRALLSVIRQADPAAPPAFITVLKHHAESATLERFARALVNHWIANGMEARDRWVIRSVGLFATERNVAWLVGLIQSWGGKGEKAAAMLGMECLQAIGTNDPVRRLVAMTQKQRRKKDWPSALQKKAATILEALAQSLGLTRDELEDRAVRTLGLDVHGRRTFDLGTRRVETRLGGNLTWLLRDSSGKERRDFPKPGARDDTPAFEEAREAWKQARDGLTLILKEQGPRFEKAMFNGRRWSRSSFDNLILGHPVLARFARLLLWGSFDAAGRLGSAFRLTEENTCVDRNEDRCDLGADDRIGIVHPALLDVAARQRWGEVFADHKLVPPFTQLARPVFALKAGEETVSSRFASIEVPADVLSKGLFRRGWFYARFVYPEPIFSQHRPFAWADQTAVIEHTPGIKKYSEKQSLPQTINRLYFVRGTFGKDADVPKSPVLPLAEADPIAVSEALFDLTTVMAPGT